jgi:starch synthase
MRVVHVTSEVTPYAKTGGLGDVGAALPRYLHELGVEQRVFMPFYSSVDRSQTWFVPVEFLRNIRLQIASHQYVFSVYTTRLPDTDLWVYLIDCPVLFHRDRLYTHDADEHLRFAVLCAAALHCCQHMGFSPDVVHCHDWQTALLPLYLKTLFAWDHLFEHTRSLLTIHNLAFQGWFDAGAVTDVGLGPHAAQVHQQDLANGAFSFLKTGILHATALSTVSPTYAREIQTPEYGEGMDDLLRARDSTFVGILNGIDADTWNPRTDPLLPLNYGPDSLSGKLANKRHLLDALGLDADRGHGPAPPLLGMVSRLTSQKGQELLFEALPWVLDRHPMQVAVLGSGETRLEDFFEALQHRYPGRVCFYRGYNETLAHLIEAGADMFLMPSRYEPCGLNQMYSLVYGTVPIVRRTGGLADTVMQYDTQTGTGNGVVFEDYDAGAVVWGLERALSLYRQPEHWQRMVHNGMAEDFSWPRRAAEYLRLYRLLGRL